MGELTVIPSSQPRCTANADDPSIPLSKTNPTPYCPASSTGPSGCFIQSNGLVCASLSTTRGFLYQAPSIQTNQTDAAMITPSLSFPAPSAGNNSTNGTAPLPGFMHLGEACDPIPLPTDSTLRNLVTWAALSSLEAAAHHSPLGLGQGADASTWFTYRGDCARGTYCDLAGQDGGSTRICKEQLPNYHNCTSYMQCLSLRCDTLEAERSAVALDRQPWSLSVLTRRAAGRTLCLPRSYPRTGGGGNGTSHNNGGDASTPPSSSSSSSSAEGFRPWMGGLLAALVVFGGLFIFLLVQRRNRRENMRKELMKEMERQAAATGCRRGAKSKDVKRPSIHDRRASRSLDKHVKYDWNHSDVRSTPPPPQQQKQQNYRYQQGAVAPLAVDSSSSVHLMGSSTPLSAMDTPHTFQECTDTVPQIPLLALHLSPPPTITTSWSSPSEEAGIRGDEALLMPQRPSGSLHSSPSLLTKSSPLTSASSSPLPPPSQHPLGSNRISSAPVSPISPLSTVSPISPTKYEEGYFDASAPSLPTTRRSQRSSHIHGARKGL